MPYKDKEKEQQCQKEYCQKHLEEIKEYKKKWNQEHLEYQKKYQKKYCQEHRKEAIQRSKKWDQEHPGYCKKRVRQWIKEHLEYKKEYNKEWQKKNRKKLNQYSNQWQKERKKIDIKFHLDCIMGAAIQGSLKNKKAGRKWETLIGYTVIDLMKHLENLFDKNMSWNNYASYWEIDHRKPKSLFHYVYPEDKEFKECWALKNLQPLEVGENRRKYNNYPDYGTG